MAKPKPIPFATVKHTFTPALGMKLAEHILRTVKEGKLFGEDGQILFHATEDPPDQYIEASADEALDFVIEILQGTQRFAVAIEEGMRKRKEDEGPDIHLPPSR